MLSANRKFLLLLCALLVCGTCLHAQVPQTPNLKMNLPPDGYLNWGTLANQNFVILDTTINQIQRQNQGVWSSSLTYGLGNMVSFNGTTYQSLVVNNRNQQPDISPAAWVPVGLTVVNSGKVVWPAPCEGVYQPSTNTCVPPTTLPNGIVFGTSPNSGTTATSSQVIATINSSPTTLIAPAVLPQATTDAFGAVKPDGETITVSGGVIKAINGVPGGSLHQFQFNAGGNNFGGSTVNTDATGTQLNASQVNLTIAAHNYAVLFPAGCTFSFGSAPTPLQCALLDANHFASTNGGQALLKLSAETYNVDGELLLNNSGVSSVVIQGDGLANSIINYSGNAPIDSVIGQNGGSFVRSTITGLRINANGLAQHCINASSLNRTRIDDVLCSDATVSGFRIGGNEVTMSNDKVQASGSVLQGHGAGFIATVSGGVVTALTPASVASTVTVVSGGTGYTAPTPVFSGANCQTLPTGSFQTTGTAPNRTITGFNFVERGFCSAAPTLTASDTTGTGASFTVNLNTFGGTGYTPSNTALNFYGSGAANAPDQPCDTLPVATLTFSSPTAPATITGATIVSGGVNCQATTFPSVYDGPAIQYGMEFFATDSSIYDFEASVGQLAGLFTHNADGTTVIHYHPYFIPTGWLNSAGAIKSFGLECDSTRHYCLDTNFYLELHGTSQVWDGNRPYPGASFMHLTSSAANATYISGLTCSNTANDGGYQTFVSNSLGAIDLDNGFVPLTAFNLADCRPAGTSPNRNYSGIQTDFNNAVNYNTRAVATASNPTSQSQIENWNFNAWNGSASRTYTGFWSFLPALTGPFSSVLQFQFPARDTNVIASELDMLDVTPGTATSTNCGPGYKSLYSAFNGTGSSQRYGMFAPCIKTAGTNTDDYMSLLWNSTSTHRHFFLDVFTDVDWNDDTFMIRNGGGIICAGTSTAAPCNGAYRARHFHVWNNSNSTFDDVTFNGTANRTAAFPDIAGTIQINSEADVTWSATPSLNILASVNYIVLAGNTSPTIPNGAAGQCFDLQAAENATGGFSWTWPANTTVSSQAVAFVTTGNALNYYRACWNVPSSKWFIK